MSPFQPQFIFIIVTFSILIFLSHFLLSLSRYFFLSFSLTLFYHFLATSFCLSFHFVLSLSRYFFLSIFLTLFYHFLTTSFCLSFSLCSITFSLLLSVYLSHSIPLFHLVSLIYFHSICDSKRVSWGYSFPLTDISSNYEILDTKFSFKIN